MIIATAPTRIDLAGGTLDIWPLFLLHADPVTVNAAIDLRAEARVAPRARGVRIESLDRGVSQEAGEAAAITLPELMLAARTLQELAPDTPCEVRLLSRVPAGSGLGGSSALAIALAAAVLALTGRELGGEPLIALVQDIETTLLAVPTGRQDYAAAVWGGTAALWWRAGGVRREAFELPGLDRHLVVAYTGEPHFSGANNWEVTRARIDRDPQVTDRLEAIAVAARACARALAAGELEAAGAAMAREWEARRRLTPSIATPALDELVAKARAQGAWGAKVCGAGGGGCLVCLAPADRRQAIRETLAQAGAQLLDCRPDPRGLEVRVES